MKYAKLDRNKVIQTQPNREDGFIGVADDVVAGMIEENGVYIAYKFIMLDTTLDLYVSDTSAIQTNAQALKLEEIVKANEIADQLDIDYMSTTFQADKYSQDLIVSVLSAGSVPSGFFWLDKLNNQVTMTYAELQGLSAAILARGQTNFAKYQNLKEQINLAKTQADLDLIMWAMIWA